MDFIRNALISLWNFVSAFFMTAFFVVGVVLVIAEMIIPGVGLLGIGGAVCIVISIIIFSKSVMQAVILSLLAVAVIAALLFLSEWVLAKLFGGKKRGRNGNFVPVAIDEKLIGIECIAKTDIAPTGTAELTNGEITVTAVGKKTICAGERIRIEGIKGGTVFVEKLKEN